MSRFIKTILGVIVGAMLSIVLFIATLTLFVAISTGLFTSEQPIESGTVLEINLREAIVDSAEVPPLINISSISLNSSVQITILKMIEALEAAAYDPNIVAISLRMDGFEPLSLANAEELRNALLSFREVSGKPIYAYAESYSQVGYYLASIADKIYLHPLGAIEWQGVAINSLYYGALLSKMDIEAEVFRPKGCIYKSAVEPFTLNAASKQSREQNQRLVDNIWESILEEVSVTRGISSDKLNNLANTEIQIDPSTAYNEGLISDIAYEDQYSTSLINVGAESRDGAPRRVTLARYGWSLEMLGGDGSPNKIAVIYADGVIVDGVGDSEFEDVASQRMVRQLRRVREDEDIKSVVVRVNSPGGSAMAADVIWREMNLLRKEKPLIISMGAYAASGGYYISAPADIILADRYTITGSIGVYGMLFNIEDALRNKLYINIDGVGSNPSADFGRSAREVTPRERAAIMRGVDGIYASFLDKVSSGRNIPLQRVEQLSGGAVWSGIEAEKSGLIDGLGGLKGALLLAAQHSKLEVGEYEIIEITEETSELRLLLSTIMASVGLGGSLSELPELLKSELHLLHTTQSGLFAVSPLKLEF